MILSATVNEGMEVPRTIDTASDNDIVTDIRGVQSFKLMTWRENVLELTVKTVEINRHRLPPFLDQP